MACASQGYKGVAAAAIADITEHVPSNCIVGRLPLIRASLAAAAAADAAACTILERVTYLLCSPASHMYC
jgi:hypothetical protein